MITSPSTISTSIFDSPRLLLRGEGAALFIAAIAAYVHQDGSWWMFPLLLLLPDLFMLGYTLNTRWGAWVYNMGHTTSVVLLVLGVGFVADSQFVIQLALIWLAHIGMDRMLGFGLKYPTVFKDTHLQRV